MYGKPSLLNVDLRPERGIGRSCTNPTTGKVSPGRGMNDNKRRGAESTGDATKTRSYIAMTGRASKVLFAVMFAVSFVIGAVRFHMVHQPIISSSFDIPDTVLAKSPDPGAILADVPDPSEFMDLSVADSVDVPAKSFLIYDVKTGQVYARKRQDDKLPIASLTKMMTALVVLDEYADAPDDGIEIKTSYRYDVDKDWVLGLEAGDKITLETMLEAMLISSYNDVAFDFALNDPNTDYVGFVDKMNKKAKALGMYDTHFTNPAGLDNDENYSTANDLHILVRKFWSVDRLAEIVGKSHADIEYSKADGTRVEKSLKSTNKMYTDRFVNFGTVGVKTGYTEDAGQCFAGAFALPWLRSGVDSAHEPIVGTIVLGAEDRFDETSRLLDAIER